MVAAAPPGWRVVAVPTTSAWASPSAPTGRTRLADRVHDLGALTDALGIDGPVVTVAHDWGGAISLGWALEHRDQLAGIVLTNTAVSQPPGSRVPALIALARDRGAAPADCVATTHVPRRHAARWPTPAVEPTFGRRTARPTAGSARRRAIGDFVADIPLRSRPPVVAHARSRDRRGRPRALDVPALLLWGPRDPVFADRYLRDLDRPAAAGGRAPLRGRRPPRAEDVDVSGAIRSWLERKPTAGGPPQADARGVRERIRLTTADPGGRYGPNWSGVRPTSRQR